MKGVGWLAGGVEVSLAGGSKELGVKGVGSLAGGVEVSLAAGTGGSGVAAGRGAGSGSATGTWSVGGAQPVASAGALNAGSGPIPKAARSAGPSSVLGPGAPTSVAGEATSPRQSVPAGPGGARFTPAGGVGVSGSGGGRRRASRSAAAWASTATSSTAESASSILCQVPTPSGGGLARSRLRALRHSFSRCLVSLGTATVGLRADLRTPAAVTAQGTQ